MSSIQQLIQIYGQTSDQSYYNRIIEKINSNQKIWVSRSSVTNNFYVDYVKGAPTAFIFSEGRFCEDFREFLASSGIIIETSECNVIDRGAMFSDMYRSGIEQVVIDNGKTLLYAQLSDFAEKPDYSKLPESGRPIVNPELVQSANSFYQTAAVDQNSRQFEDVMLQNVFRAKYLLPLIDSEAKAQGETLCKMKTGEGQMLLIPAMKMQDGANCIPVFTDWIELKKFDENRICSGNIISFKEIEYFCSGGAKVSINPMGFNMILDKNTVNYINHSVKGESENITVFSLDTVQGEMISAMTALFEKSGIVSNAYICGIRKDGVPGYLIIIDCDEGKENDVAEFPKILSQYSDGVPIHMVKYNSEFGKQAAQGREAFYTRIKI